MDGAGDFSNERRADQSDTVDVAKVFKNYLGAPLATGAVSIFFVFDGILVKEQSVDYAYTIHTGMWEFDEMSHSDYIQGGIGYTYSDMYFNAVQTLHRGIVSIDVRVFGDGGHLEDTYAGFI